MTDYIFSLPTFLFSKRKVSTAWMQNYQGYLSSLHWWIGAVSSKGVEDAEVLFRIPRTPQTCKLSHIVSAEKNSGWNKIYKNEKVVILINIPRLDCLSIASSITQNLHNIETSGLLVKQLYRIFLLLILHSVLLCFK